MVAWEADAESTVYMEPSPYQSYMARINKAKNLTTTIIDDMTEEESKVVSRLRQTTPKAILVTLLENDRLEFQEIVSNAGKASATVSFYLSKLVADEIVSYKKVDMKKQYFIVEKQRIANLITEYHPDVIESASDNLADIMSSL